MSVTPADLQQLFSLFQARRFEAMEQLAQRMVQIHPTAGICWKALGIARQAQGKDALDALQRAADLLPADAELQAGLGQYLLLAGDLPSALASLNRALALKPGMADAELNLGHVLMKLGRQEEAAARYQTAAGLDAGNPHAHACLGAALHQLGRFEEATSSYSRAVTLRPDLAAIHFSLGSVLIELGRHDEAELSLRRALELQPDHAAAHGNLGNALKNQGRLDEAVSAYERALELEPAVPLNHANLGAALRDAGHMREALSCFRGVLGLNGEHFAALSDCLFIQAYLGDDAAPTRKADAERFGALAAAKARPFTRWKSRSEGARLRVGFVSADLREHPVGYFFEAAVAALSRHHRDDIELFVYANSDTQDVLTQRLQAHCSAWCSIARLDDEAAARRIHADGLDLLVDLSGHTAGNRLPLFAWKPAPTQASWLGCCATTGLAAMDGYIADPWIAPPGAEAEFTERLWRLPETFLCFTPPKLELAPAPLPALASGHITFACFNKLNKLNDPVLAVWSRVLHAVPRSRLFLKNGPLGAASQRQRMTECFAAYGIPADRLILEGASPREDYLRAYGRVDIALDPFPYPGGTTSIEGLWMGVPVLTLAGSCALARQGESILHNLGLAGWIAADADAYVSLAAGHAADVAGLAALRQQLRPALLASPLCDAPRFARNLMDLLQQARRP